MSKKSQILMLLLLAALIFITPLLSSSFRTTYLYFIINILIFVLGAEAGLLSASSKPPPGDTKPDTTTLNSVSKIAKPTCSVSAEVEIKQEGEEKAKMMRKSASDKSHDSIGILKKLDNKSPSTPSLFFIGGEESDREEDSDHDVKEEESQETEGGSGQELFTKAETFIGNFYEQLKMQRQESWKKIHEVYQKAY